MKVYNYSIEHYNFFENGKKEQYILKLSFNDFIKNNDKRI